MLYAIHALDRPDSLQKRKEHYPAHHAFLDGAAKLGVTIIMSGPMVGDDGKTPVGSLFIVEAPDRKTAEAFNRADPFYKADIWDAPTITAFIKRRG